MRSRHHSTKVQVAPGIWEYPRPLRDTSWWHRWRAERACRKVTNHCWHPDAFADWWCCMCSADTGGMPPQKCVHCAEVSRLAAAVKTAEGQPIRTSIDEASGITGSSPSSEVDRG